MNSTTQTRDGRDPRGEGNRKDVRDGVAAGLPIFAGYLPVAVAFGLLVREQSLGIEVAGAWSLFVFAGAAQFIAIDMYAAGSGFAAIVVTTFVVNLRHLLMSSAVAERMPNLTKRALVAFGMTDEVFAVATADDERSTTFLIALEATAYVGWVGGTFLGYAFGSFLPPIVKHALGVLLYALFAALLTPRIVADPRTALSAVVGAVANWLLLHAGVESVGVRIPLAIILGAFAGAVVSGRSRRPGGRSRRPGGRSRRPSGPQTESGVGR